MKAYSLSEHSLTWGGAPLEEQIGEITITPNVKNFSLRVANDGVATMVANKDISHTIKVKCFQGSAVNDVLSATLNLALQSPGGNAGIVPMGLTDRQGSSVFAAAEAFITGFPETVLGSELGDVEWEIAVPSPVRHVGSN